MEEAGSGHEDSSHNILTLDALQVLSRSQVTPGLSMSYVCKVYAIYHTGVGTTACDTIETTLFVDCHQGILFGRFIVRSQNVD
jgi:hypothetical protein